MKYKLLRKRQIIEGSIGAIVLSIFIAIALFLNNKSHEISSVQSRMQGEVSAIANETNGLREKFIRLQNNRETFTQVMNLYNNDMLSHSTAIVESLFREYEDRYSLNSWSFDSQKSNHALDASKYQRKTNLIVRRDAVVKFEAVNDADILSMMHKIQQDFPGAVSFTKLTMSRQSTISDEILRTITERGSYALVAGELNFAWYAIEPTDPEELKRRNQSSSSRRPRRRQ
jgi:hypothetical protein